MIAHIVLFNPRPEFNAGEILAFALRVQTAFRQIPSIKRAMLGRRIHVDPGYERSFGGSTYEFTAALEFDDLDGLLAYLTHPAHAAIGQEFWEYCGSTLITEVETTDALSGDFKHIIGDMT